MNNIDKISLSSCDYCSFQFLNNEKFCPQCGIPNRKLQELKDDGYYICPVCEEKNLKGERKCNYCCSLL